MKITTQGDNQLKIKETHALSSSPKNYKHDIFREIYAKQCRLYDLENNKK